jgi:hypothetical protein
MKIYMGGKRELKKILKQIYHPIHGQVGIG